MATPVFTVRLDETLRGQVRDTATRWGTTESEVVRRILANQTALQPLSQLGAKALPSAEAEAKREAAAVGQ